MAVLKSAKVRAERKTDISKSNARRMALVRATVQSLSVAWLLLPFGALPARACLYLNERSHGRIIHYFLLIIVDYYDCHHC